MASELESALLHEEEFCYPLTSHLKAQLHRECHQLAKAMRKFFQTCSPAKPLFQSSIRNVSELESLAYKRQRVSEALTVVSGQLRPRLLRSNVVENICVLEFDQGVSDAVKAWQKDPSELVSAYLKGPSARLADGIVNGVLGEHCCGDVPALEWLAAVMHRCEGKERVGLAAALAFGFRDQTLLFFAAKAVDCCRVSYENGCIELTVERLDAILCTDEPPEELVKIVHLLDQAEAVGKKNGLCAEVFINELVAKFLELLLSSVNRQLSLSPVFTQLRQRSCILHRFMQRQRSTAPLPLNYSLHGCNWILHEANLGLLQESLFKGKGLTLEAHPEAKNEIYIIPLEDVKSLKEVKLYQGIIALLGQAEEALYREAVTVHPRLAFDSRLSELQRIHNDLQMLHGQAFELQSYMQSMQQSIDELELMLDALKTSQRTISSMLSDSETTDESSWTWSSMQNVQDALHTGTHAFVCGTKLQTGTFGTLSTSLDNNSVGLDDQMLFLCSHVVAVRFDHLTKNQHVPEHKIDDGSYEFKVNVLLQNDDLVQFHMRSPMTALLWTYGLQQLSHNKSTMRTLTQEEYQRQRAFYVARAQNTTYP